MNGYRNGFKNDNTTFCLTECDVWHFSTLGLGSYFKSVQLFFSRSDVVHPVHPEYLQVILAGSEQNSKIILCPAPCARYRLLSVKFERKQMLFCFCYKNTCSAIHKINFGPADFSDKVRGVSIPRQSRLPCSASSAPPTWKHPRPSLHRHRSKSHQLHG